MAEGLHATDFPSIFRTTVIKCKEMVRYTNEFLEHSDSTQPPDPKFGKKVDEHGNVIDSISHFTPWKDHVNTTNAPVLAAIAGDDFIGIDCDTDELFNEFLRADNGQCTYVTKSDMQGKGGHLLYRYKEKLSYSGIGISTFDKQAKLEKLDLQRGNKLIYLATVGNKTKIPLSEQTLTSLDDLIEIPKEVNMLLSMLILLEDAKKLHNIEFSNNIESFSNNARLGFKLKGLLPSDQFDSEIFNSIKPANSAAIKSPNDIPFGMGDDFLHRVITKLGMDDTVSPEVFRNTIHWFNNLWSSPMPHGQIESKINIQLSTANRNGSPLFVFNKDWEREGCIFPNVVGDTIECYYELATGRFIMYNYTTNHIDILANKMLATNYYESLTGKKAPPTFIQRAKSVAIIDSPLYSSFYSIGDDEAIGKFNLFIPTEGVNILKTPSLVKEPKYPSHILGFLEHLIPNEVHRLWMLKFIRRKHLTYKPSAVNIMLEGVGGSGKGVFVDTILGYFSGTKRLNKPSLTTVLDKFNSWKLSSDYVILDEIGESLTNDERARLVGVIKETSGNPMFTPHYKGVDSRASLVQKHHITFVITSNVSVSLITKGIVDDRRVCRFVCPVPLSRITEDTELYINRIKEELPHFAHYLATEIPDFDDNAHYNSNVLFKDDAYYEYIDEVAHPLSLLETAISKMDLQKLVQALHDKFNIPMSKVELLFDNRLKPKTMDGSTRILLRDTDGTLGLGIQSLMTLLLDNTTLKYAALSTLAQHSKKSTLSVGREGVSSYRYLSFDGYYTSYDEPEEITGEEIEL